ENLCYCSFAVNQQQQLSIEVHFDMRVTGVAWLRGLGLHDRVEVAARELTGDFSFLPLLKKDQRVSRGFVDRAVGWPRFVAQLRQSPFRVSKLSSRQRTIHDAFAFLAGGRRGCGQ